MPPTHHDNPFRIGLAAARANLGPGIALIGLALAIVVGYYTLPLVTEALNAVADFRQQKGLIFAMASTALFGGTIPVIIQQLRPSTRKPRGVTSLLYLTFFWALKGIEVDVLYRFEASFFGDNTNWTTIAAKTFFDQGIYCTVWAVPVTLLGYVFHDCRYSFPATWQRLRRGWIRREVVPTLVANWTVWCPAVALIYCLKLPLQLPVQNIVLCLWAILMMSMTRGPVKATATREVLISSPGRPVR